MANTGFTLIVGDYNSIALVHSLVYFVKSLKSGFNEAADDDDFKSSSSSSDESISSR